MLPVPARHFALTAALLAAPAFAAPGSGYSTSLRTEPPPPRYQMSGFFVVPTPKVSIDTMYSSPSTVRYARPDLYTRSMQLGTIDSQATSFNSKISPYPTIDSTIAVPKYMGTIPPSHVDRVIEERRAAVAETADGELVRLAGGIGPATPNTFSPAMVVRKPSAVSIDSRISEMFQSGVSYSGAVMDNTMSLRASVDVPYPSPPRSGEPHPYVPERAVASPEERTVNSANSMQGWRQGYGPIAAIHQGTFTENEKIALLVMVEVAACLVAWAIYIIVRRRGEPV